MRKLIVGLLIALAFSGCVDKGVPVVAFGASDTWLNNTRVMMTWKACDTVDPEVDCTINLNSEQIFRMNTTCINHETTLKLIEGTNTISVQCRDESGNVGIASKVLMVDTGKPTVEILSFRTQ